MSILYQNYKFDILLNVILYVSFEIQSTQKETWI